jgi:hypothetical protein
MALCKRCGELAEVSGLIGIRHNDDCFSCTCPLLGGQAARKPRRALARHNWLD